MLLTTTFPFQSAREELCRLQEALLCRICMDDDISAVFCPCGHAVACHSCALRCSQCPVCRAPATHTQPIYLPTSSSTGHDRKRLADNGKVTRLICCYDAHSLVDNLLFPFVDSAEQCGIELTMSARGGNTLPETIVEQQ